MTQVGLDDMLRCENGFIENGPSISSNKLVFLEELLRKIKTNLSISKAQHKGEISLSNSQKFKRQGLRYGVHNLRKSKPSDSNYNSVSVHFNH